MINVKVPNLEITKASHVEAGSTEPIPWNQSRSAPLPTYCRVEGILNRRTGVGGEEFGITFVLALPDKWNGDFLMQGGGGSNGIVLAPLGLNAAGDTAGLMRGFAVASTVFNGIISGDPAMRTGLSNLAIGRWIPIAFNQVAPKDTNGKPIIEQAITDNDRKRIKTPS